MYLAKQNRDLLGYKKRNRKRRISDDFFVSAKEFVLAIDLKMMFEILGLLCISRCDRQAVLKELTLSTSYKIYEQLPSLICKSKRL